MSGNVPGLEPSWTITGKYQPPGFSGTAVTRVRLTDILDAGVDDTTRAFTMLSAPAGFGKTFLLGQWASTLMAANVLAAWCTLDQDDRDPQVLWTTITSAIMLAAEGIDDAFSAELASVPPVMDPQHHGNFVAQVTAVIESYREPIVLIIDDAHVIEGSPAEAELIRLLRWAPTNLRVALATRSPMSTQAARVTGGLTEVTADTLSFTRTETNDFFVDEMLDDDDIEKLYSMTDGWPAALSLARLGMQKYGERAPASDELLDPAIVYDYLDHEVYSEFSERERAVIVCASVTPLITGDLVSAGVGIPDSGEVLRDLAMRNRMLRRVSTDLHGRTWYSVQPLFATFLRETVRDADPERLAELAARAAEWQSLHGNSLAALKLAVNADNSGLVESILRQRGYSLVSEGHANELLQVAPSSMNNERLGPFSQLMVAFAAVSAGRADRAQELIVPPPLTELSADDLLEWDWLYYLVHVRLALAQGSSIETLYPGWPEETLSDVPDQLRSAVRLSRGLVEAHTGSIDIAGTDLRLALASAENIDDLSSRLRSTVGLAQVSYAEFDVRATLANAERALELSARSTTQDYSAPTATAHGLAAWAYYELLDLPKARWHIDSAKVLLDDQSDEALRSWIQQMYNAAFFDTMPFRRRIAQEFVTAWPAEYLRNASAASVVSSLHFGLSMSAELDERRWSERLLDGARQLIGEGHDWQVAYALYLFRCGKDAAARSVLAPLLIDEVAERLALSDIVAWSLDSALEERAHNSFRAHSAILRALEIANDCGGLYEVTRPDVRSLARVLSAGVDRFGAHEQVARQLLALNIGESTLSSGPLTERERQILAELKSLRTIEEIARDLLLSVNTVKTHMRGIYRKLDVQSRRSAIATAERLGLI
jgi:LuxR family transcriptional regulator, maltose regulon positive regulatory protein